MKLQTGTPLFRFLPSLFCKSRVGLLFWIAGILVLSPASRAAVLYDFVAGGAGNGSTFSTFPGNWGFNFTVTSSTTVASLGLWDEGANGLAASHSVGVFQTSGLLITSAVITSSSTQVASNNTNGDWLFSDLATPVVLSPGTYTLGFYNQTGAVETFRGSATITMLSGDTWNSA